MRLARDVGGTRTAWRQVRSADVAASSVGHIRQAALGDALEPRANRVQRGVERIIKRGGLSPDQQKWLRRIGVQVAEIGVAEAAAARQAVRPPVGVTMNRPAAVHARP